MTAPAPTRFADLAFELRFDPLVDQQSYELRFDPLVEQQSPLSFPCDAHGCVDLDELCDRSRCDYMFAHALIGRAFTVPVVLACAA